MKPILFVILSLFLFYACSQRSQIRADRIDLPPNISADSSIHTDSDTTKPDSSSLKPSIAPVIAFGLLGAFLGGGIGGAIDPPDNGIEGEINLSISKTGAALFIVGGIGGGFIGYRLAKRQVEMKKRKLKEAESDTTSTKIESKYDH